MPCLDSQRKSDLENGVQSSQCPAGPGALLQCPAADVDAGALKNRFNGVAQVQADAFMLRRGHCK